MIIILFSSTLLIHLPTFRIFLLFLSTDQNSCLMIHIFLGYFGILSFLNLFDILIVSVELLLYHERLVALFLLLFVGTLTLYSDIIYWVYGPIL